MNWSGLSSGSSNSTDHKRLIGCICTSIALGVFLRTNDSRWIRGGLATSVIIAFGSFLASNVQIGSDFVWFIALLFALAVCTAIAMLRAGTRKP